MEGTKGQDKPKGNSLIHTEYFCVDCGSQDVWYDSNEPPDYYMGTELICYSCGNRFSIGDVLT